MQCFQQNKLGAASRVDAQNDSTRSAALSTGSQQNKFYWAIIGVLTAVNVNMTAILNVTPCNLLDSHKSFRRARFLRLPH